MTSAVLAMAFLRGGNEADPSHQPAESCSSHGDLKNVPPVPRSSVLPAVGDGVFSASAYLLGGNDADPAHVISALDRHTC